jgi:hypothetical protein
MSVTGRRKMIDQSINYDGLMQANLARVFSERDASGRMRAIAELYADNAILYEPDGSATGHAAISHPWKHYYRACRQTSPSTRLVPLSAITLTISPRIGSGAPTTATRSTAGCARIQSSISVGPIRYPPLLMRSSSRPLYQK